MNKKILFTIVGLGFLVSGCGPTSNFFVRDESLARHTKKVAVLPFQYANNRASEDPSVETGAMTLKFLSYSQGVLTHRYEFIPMDSVMAELKSMGFEGLDPNKSFLLRAYQQPTGYTLPQALKIGKNLGADAIFLGEVAVSQQAPTFSISVRLLDVKTGKVIVAGSAASGFGISFTPWVAPMQKIVERFAREVPQ